MNSEEEKMAEWLAHPMEFGKPPEKIKEIYRVETDWPLFDEKVTFALHSYEMENKYSAIGMTGPITWSFLDIKFDQFSPEELKVLYAGWHVNFIAINSENYSPEKSQEKQNEILQQLSSNVPGFIEIVDFLYIGDLLFYAYTVKNDQNDILTIAEYDDERIEFELNSKYLQLPPLYYFIGTLFFDGKL